MINPKQRFLDDSKTAAAWHEFVANPMFVKAVEAAFAQYAKGVGGDGLDGPTLAIVGMKIEGAKGFIEELMNLGRQTKPDFSQSKDSLTPT